MLNRNALPGAAGVALPDLRRPTPSMMRIVTAMTEAGAHRDSKGWEYPPGIWHSLICLMPDTIIFECKPGPFSPIKAEDIAPWAPEEATEEAADCVRWMRRAKPGERFPRDDDGSTWS